MPQFLKVLLIIVIVVVIVLAILYFVGTKLQKKQLAQQEQMEAVKQNVTLMAIDKKKLPVKESGLPQMVIDQTPKLMRRSKMPIVKAKVGTRIITMVADPRIFDIIPLMKEVKATVSGIYITDVRGLRGPLEAPPTKPKFWTRVKNRFTGKKDNKDNNKKDTSKKKA